MPDERADRAPLSGQDAGPEPEVAPDLTPAPADQVSIRAGAKPDELLVFDHGFVRLDAAMADDLSVVNGARVSFAVRKEVMDERDKGLIRFLMRDGHGSPFEHNSFRFHIRTPIFVAREWFRHRIGCLTGDTVVTFVDTAGHATPSLEKTLDELWRMWTFGERNGHAVAPRDAEEIDRLAQSGCSVRAVARHTGVGRRAITRHLKEGSTEFRDARSRLQRMKLRVLDEDDSEFGIGHLGDVIDSGLQPVYRVTLADGKELKLTENHRVLTDTGWKPLREAVGLQGSGPQAVMTVPCRLMTNGERAYRDPEWLRTQRQAGLSVAEMASAAGCSYHTIRSWLRKHSLQFSQDEHAFPSGNVPWNKGVRGYRLDRTTTDGQRQAIRNARSGPKSNFWRGGLSSERASIAGWTTEQAPAVHARFDYTCRSCGQRGGRLHAHHIVPVWLDRSKARILGNLITVCCSCHRRIHRTQVEELKFACRFFPLLDKTSVLHQPPRQGWRLTARPVLVISCEYLGLQQTYDLSVEGPWHNFVANGVVVHNSFNEESARYHQLESDFYVPAAGAVRSQVGKPGSYSFEPVDNDTARDARATFARVYRQLYTEYQALIEKGVAKELARALLPFGIYTQFYWTLNARSLMNFLSLRNSDSAQYEIRTYAEAVERLFATKMPVTHECFLEFGRKVP